MNLASLPSILRAVVGVVPLAGLAVIVGCSSTSAPNPPVLDAAATLDSLPDPALVEAGDPEAANGPTGAEAGPACAEAFAGCTSFSDATADDADRTIHFQDYSYDPKCLLVRAGQTVTFVGDFIRHPLTPSCGPELLLEYRDTGPSASFSLADAGLYGYYCLDHGNPQGDAMAGAIQVVP